MHLTSQDWNSYISCGSRSSVHNSVQNKVSTEIAHLTTDIGSMFTCKLKLIVPLLLLH